MVTSEVYNFLDGKNLCNIFATIIVNKINETFPNAKTEITVINVRNFFIIKGRTNSDQVLIISDLFQEFTNKYNEELSNTIRVIDTILYNVEFTPSPINISYDSNKKIFKEELISQNFVNSHIKDNLYFNLKIEGSSNLIYFDCSTEDTNKVFSILESKYPEYHVVKSDFSQEIYVSDRYYGLSNHGEKLYHILLRYITHHLFTLGISKELNIKLMSSVKIEDMDNNNTEFIITNDNHMVKTEWLESLILDIFPFTQEELKESFDLSSYNPIDEIILSENILPWEKLDRVKDIVLI
jgi:hypothetical protein